VTRPVETLSDPPSRTDLQGGTTEFADALRLTLGLQGEQPSSLHAWGADSPTEFHATLTPVSVSTSASASGLSSGYSSSSSRLAPRMGTGDSLSRSGQSSRSRYDYREPGRGQPSASSERARPFRTRPSSYRPRSPPPRSRSPLPSPHSRSLYSSHRRPHSRSPSPRRPSSPPRRSRMPSPPRRYPSPARRPRSPPAARRSRSPPPMIRRPRSPSPRRFRQPSPVSRRGELSDSLALVRRDVGAPPSMLVPNQPRSIASWHEERIIQDPRTGAMAVAPVTFATFESLGFSESGARMTESRELSSRPPGQQFRQSPSPPRSGTRARDASGRRHGPAPSGRSSRD